MMHVAAAAAAAADAAAAAAAAWCCCCPLVQAGHLVRTKRSNSNEGGVAAGFAVLDSPYLVD